MRRATAAVMLVLGGLFSAQGAAQAATFTVNSTDDATGECPAVCTLRGAIRAANASPGGDTVQMPAGTFALTLNGNDDNAALGDLDVHESLTIIGAGRGATTIDGSALLDGVFDVKATDGESSGNVERFALEDLTLARPNDGNDAAAIDAFALEVALRRVAITDGTGEELIEAGTVNGASGSLVLDDARLTGNTLDGELIDADPDGDGTVTVAASTIDANTVDDEILDADPGGAGTVTIRDSSISGNTLTDDDEVIDHNPSSDSGTLTIERSTLSRNTATDDGPIEDARLIDFNPSGRDDVLATLRIADARFADNAMQVLLIDPSSGDETTVDALIERSVFSGNDSIFDGAAIGFEPSTDVGGRGTLAIRDSAFDGNGSPFSGGAIASRPFLETALLEVSGSTFSGNAATFGGAIAVAATGFDATNELRVANSTFSGNVARAPEDQGGEGGFGFAGGGAITVDPRIGATLTHVTIAGNRVEGLGTGGGVHTSGLDGGIDRAARNEVDLAGAVTVANSIVADNRAGEAANDCSAPVESAGGNLEGAKTCGFTGDGDKQDTDPLLAELADNGGATHTRAIGRESPAFDAARAAACLATDQRGVARPQFAGCDIGAFELAPGSPPPPPPPAPPAPAAQGGVLGTTARSCVSRRRFTIRLRNRGRKVAKAVVRVNGKRVAVRRGRRLKSTVDLRGLPKGRFTVEITLTLRDGRQISGKRRYLTCTPARNDGRPPRV